MQRFLGFALDMRSARRAGVLFAGLGSILALYACGDSTGGITAQIRIIEREADLAKQGLRSAAVPMEIGRLTITAFETTGSTLASTTLTEVPGTGEEQLLYEGGSWQLDNVSVGINRTVRGEAFIKMLPNNPALSGALAFRGELGGIEVRSDQVTQAGVIELRLVPGVRIPRLDMQAPGTPSPVDAMPVPAGQSLSISFTPPPDDDVAGYLVAYTSSLSATPAPNPDQINLLPGAAIAPGVFIGAWLDQRATVQATISGLTDGLTYKVLVYAYDADIDGRRPLNFSSPGTALAIPRDTSPPDVPLGLSVIAADPSTAEISFTGAGEDGPAGIPSAYELRVARTLAALDPATFGDQFLFTGTIPLLDPGMPVTIRPRFAELGQSSAEDFFLGLRAIDGAGNLGMIAVAQYAVNATLTPPLIQTLSPPIALAGERLVIEGGPFLALTGTVTLVQQTATAAIPLSLAVRSWSPTTISVDLPLDARSGNLIVTRTDARASAPAFLPIIRRVPGTFQPFLLPFELLSAPIATSPAALFSSRNVGATFEQSIVRLFGLTSEGIRHALFVTNDRLALVAGSYIAGPDLFLFAISTTNPALLSAASVTSTIPALPRRFGTIATAGNADGIGLELLTSTVTGPLPALIAFSTGGVVRTATTIDLATRPAIRFFTVTATSESADLMTLLRHENRAQPAQSPIRMAYRLATPNGPRLVVRTATGTGGGQNAFSELPGTRPAVGQRIVLLHVDDTIGFVVVYEELQGDGTTEVRVLALSLFGRGPGVAPFPQTGISRRLEDAGLVRHDGRPYLALTTTQFNRQLFYTELDPATLVADARIPAPTAALDFVADPVAARIGCKRTAWYDCPIVWNGPAGPGALFVRR